MQLVTVTGATWGDEGKGRVVDYLAGAPTSSFVFRAAAMPGTRSSPRRVKRSTCISSRAARCTDTR